MELIGSGRCSKTLEQDITLQHLIKRKFVHFAHPLDHHSNRCTVKTVSEQPVYCNDLFITFQFPTGELVHGFLNCTFFEAIRNILKVIRSLVAIVLKSPELKEVPEFEKSSYYPILENTPAFPNPIVCNCLVPATCVLEHLQNVPNKDDPKYAPVLFAKVPEAPRFVEMPMEPDLIDAGEFNLPTHLLSVPKESEFVPPLSHQLATVGSSFTPPSLVLPAREESRAVIGILSIMGIGTHFPDVLLFLEKLAEVCDGLVFVYSQQSYEIHHQVLSSPTCTQRLNRCQVAHVIRIRNDREGEPDDAFADFDFAIAAHLLADPGKRSAAAVLPPVFQRATHFVAAYIGFGRSIVRRGAGADTPLHVVPIDLSAAVEHRSSVSPRPVDPTNPSALARSRLVPVPVPTRSDFLPARPRIPRSRRPQRLTLADIPDAEPQPVWVEPTLGPEELAEAPQDAQWDPLCRMSCIGLRPLPRFPEPELEIPPPFEPDLSDADRRFPPPPLPEAVAEEEFVPAPYPADQPTPPRWSPARQIEPVSPPVAAVRRHCGLWRSVLSILLFS